MPVLLQYAIAFAVLIVLAPVVAMAARRYGGRVKGGFALAMLLGFGMVLDPPSKHIIEASEGEEKGGPAAGDPPAAD